MRTSLLFVKSTKKSNIRFDLGKTSNIPLCYNKLLKIENCFERNKKNIYLKLTAKTNNKRSIMEEDQKKKNIAPRFRLSKHDRHQLAPNPETLFS